MHRILTIPATHNIGFLSWKNCWFIRLEFVILCFTLFNKLHSSQKFVQGRLTFFYLSRGAQHPSGPENPLKSIDFTGPGGLAPIAPHEYAPDSSVQSGLAHFDLFWKRLSLRESVRNAEEYLDLFQLGPRIKSKIELRIWVSRDTFIFLNQERVPLTTLTSSTFQTTFIHRGPSPLNLIYSKIFWYAPMPTPKKRKKEKLKDIEIRL